MWRHAGAAIGAAPSPRRASHLLSPSTKTCPTCRRAKDASVVAPGFSCERLSRIDSAFDRALDRREIEGAVVLVLRDGQTAYERGLRVGGPRGRPGDARERHLPYHRIADQGDHERRRDGGWPRRATRAGGPESRSFIPEFALTTVMQHTRRNHSRPGRSSDRSRSATSLRTPRGSPTAPTPALAQLYRANGLGPAAGYGWYTADKDEPICETMTRLATLPFAAQPGTTRFVYGYNTDILGCVVERASEDVPRRFFIEQRFTLSPQDAASTSSSFRPRTKIALRPYMARVTGTRWCAPRMVRAGRGTTSTGHGDEFFREARASSTAADYARFLRNDAQRRNARWRPHPLAGHGRAHDHQPNRHPVLAYGSRLRPRLLRSSPPRRGGDASSPLAPLAGPGHTGPPMKSTRGSIS